MRKHLAQVEKTTGVRDSRLDAVVIPRGAEYVWSRFWDVSLGKPPTYIDLEAYVRVTGWKPLLWEVEAIMQMSCEFSAVIAEQTRRASHG